MNQEQKYETAFAQLQRRNRCATQGSTATHQVLQGQTDQDRTGNPEDSG